MTDKERLVHNERMKLRATFINNIGVGSFIGGFLLLDVPGVTFLQSCLIVMVGVGWAVLLHFIGSWFLGQLKV